MTPITLNGHVHWTDKPPLIRTLQARHPCTTALPQEIARSLAAEGADIAVADIDPADERGAPHPPVGPTAQHRLTCSGQFSILT
ncbi:hypothetical protein [Streptomyces cellulosae]|uniref:hypothetical protein n=1 Tax=Streptomyces cellulosae TaxID=1968 RepID=UPI000B224D99|nr:hypothetical protein [Streptomyces cellulosae]